MKLGAKPGKIWHKSEEIQYSFSRFNSQINRLLLLDGIWEKELGSKSKFWVLDAVKNDTVIVKVTVLASKQELLLREKEIIKSLNKYFDKPWIRQISIL